MQNEVEALRRRLNEASQEREMLEGIILKMRESEDFDARNLRFLEIPVEKTSGDLLFSAFRPDGTQHVMVGDFTGHGLKSAISSGLVSYIFYGMTKKGLSIGDIMAEINLKLNERTPADVFMAACSMEINPPRNEMKILNCALPSVLLFRNGELFQKILSESLSHGIIPDQKYTVRKIAVEREDRIFIGSDGIVEVENQNREMFGEENLIMLLTQMLKDDQDLKVVIKTLEAFRETTQKQQDDITLVEVTC